MYFRSFDIEKFIKFNISNYIKINFDKITLIGEKLIFLHEKINAYHYLINDRVKHGLLASQKRLFRCVY